MREPRRLDGDDGLPAEASGVGAELKNEMDVALKQPIPSDMVDALLQLHQGERDRAAKVTPSDPSTKKPPEGTAEG
jgi:hypothetical protein